MLDRTPSKRLDREVQVMRVWQNMRRHNGMEADVEAIREIDRRQ